MYTWARDEIYEMSELIESGRKSQPNKLKLMTILCKWVRDDLWNEWENLKRPQQPPKHIAIDGGLFLDTVLNKLAVMKVTRDDWGW